jgi:hypothetical protein
MFEYEDFVVAESIFRIDKYYVNSNEDDNFNGKYLPSFYLWVALKRW